MSDVERQIGALVAGAAAFAGRSPAERAALALRTARTVAAASNAWVEAAAAIKQSRQPTVDAEETATGPLATLRLLLLSARALADIGRITAHDEHVSPRNLSAGDGLGRG